MSNELLFHALLPIVNEIPAAADVTTVLSAGTPQAQTLWVVLIKSGLLQARMVLVIPPAFVPDPHPRAIREVTLESDTPSLTVHCQKICRLSFAHRFGSTVR